MGRTGAGLAGARGRLPPGGDWGGDVTPRGDLGESGGDMAAKSLASRVPSAPGLTGDGARGVVALGGVPGGMVGGDAGGEAGGGGEGSEATSMRESSSATIRVKASIGWPAASYRCSAIPASASMKSA